ncbi:transmembrane protein [Heterostelium album PN500]|uniref:Transmembrane protein n=1 Tax=Heterostelium pallidum (strain ATCC 26659 / Pp 5 / PN500) TaxID=670386 RepID=D3B400_HETP5|nr:transmembrane protein [Heterostelium album PN500]EFA84048.1 transmembrane protein [Heterostelium album PN500]|eukprot:XP_020436165.1 transmembrane protein [Heterostelium album PN500]
MTINKGYDMILGDSNPDTRTLTDGSLFHGYFHKYGDIWLAITFWCTVSCTLTYLLSGFIASIILRRSKLSPFIPIFTAVFGVAIGISFGGISATIIAAIYRSASFLLEWYFGVAWGVGLTILHVILAFTLRLLQV